jgi:Putative restriction endonuclease
MSVALERTYTPADLLAMPDGERYELDDGHLVERDVSMLSSRVRGRLHGFLDACVEAGVPLVWVINPETGRAHVYRRDGSVTWLREDDELSEEDVVPGFRCPLASILPERPIEQTASL